MVFGWNVNVWRWRHMRRDETEGKNTLSYYERDASLNDLTIDLFRLHTISRTITIMPRIKARALLRCDWLCVRVLIDLNNLLAFNQGCCRLSNGKLSYRVRRSNSKSPVLAALLLKQITPITFNDTAPGHQRIYYPMLMTEYKTFK